MAGGIEMLVGFLIGISCWVIVLGLKKIRVRAGINEVRKETIQKQEQLKQAEEQVKEAKIEIIAEPKPEEPKVEIPKERRLRKKETIKTPEGME